MNISDLNQYLYCPRRLYYIKYFDTIETNYYLVDGKLKHNNKSRKGGWIKELYVKSDQLGLHGNIDLLEIKNMLGSGYVPIERKRGFSYHANDEIQLAAYCMLLEDYLQETINLGYIYLFGTNQRYAITITDWHREKVKEITKAICKMTIDSIPDFTDNPNKCKKCSVVQYCMPFETKILEKKNEGQ